MKVILDKRKFTQNVDVATQNVDVATQNVDVATQNVDAAISKLFERWFVTYGLSIL
jgi:hypothetical protein